MNTRRFLPLVAIICLCFLCISCRESKTAADMKKLNYIEQAQNPRFDNTNVKKQVFDMNRDGNVDLWKFYAYKKMSDTEGDGDLLIIRKEVDLNFDGRVDRIMYYNQKENLTHEEIDTNFDGVIDRIHYYDNGMIIRTEFYQKEKNRVMIDGENNPEVNPDFVRYFRQGVLTREETDEGCDGYRELITLFNAEGNIAQVGYDDNDDGVIERWVRY